MNDPCYLYAVTWADSSPDGLGPGVDPRFAVEMVPCGPLAAAASRVGLDEFDVAKLQQGTADLPWLSQVAVRHNEIIAALARRLAVLPMRLGTIFQSRSSLIARLKPYETGVTEFLRGLGNRQEWAVKLYLERDASPAKIEPVPGQATPRGGAEYLVAKGMRLQRRRQAEARARQSAATVEDRLKDMADSWRRLSPLPHALTNRRETMVWNGAFLLPRAKIGPFQAACEQLRGELTPGGLSVELTGPWPPYHFCPSFEPRDETSPCPCNC